VGASQFSLSISDHLKLEQQKKTKEVMSSLSVSDVRDNFMCSHANDHPDNGKFGFWEVIGMQSSALNQADSAKSAIGLSPSIVEYWELTLVEYVGITLPISIEV
jgi:hypothetical protein